MIQKFLNKILVLLWISFEAANYDFELLNIQKGSKISESVLIKCRVLLSNFSVECALNENFYDERRKTLKYEQNLHSRFQHLIPAFVSGLNSNSLSTLDSDNGSRFHTLDEPFHKYDVVCLFSLSFSMLAAHAEYNGKNGFVTFEGKHVNSFQIQSQNQ